MTKEDANQSYNIRNIQDLIIGEKEEKFFEVDEQMILDFAELTSDMNPLHVDKNFGKKTIFGDINAQGQLMSSLIVGIIGSKLPGPGWFCIGVDSDFTNPCFENDKIKVSVVLEKKN